MSLKAVYGSFLTLNFQFAILVILSVNVYNHVFFLFFDTGL